MRKPIPGWPGYEADSEGFIWSCRNGGRSRVRIGIHWRKLKPGKMGNYQGVSLSDSPRRLAEYVHRLILLTFVGECPEGMEAIHLDDDKSNLRLENLRWGTHKKNCELRRSNGKDKLGSERKHSKLTESDVIWIRTSGIAFGKMANFLSVSIHTVKDAFHGRTWAHVEGGAT